ncbi:helix-turn-helix domain-containing protein [Bacteroides thetaiotaomicron]|uniref:helix-turn-helix domain-containing protein n=1 Tax=Bacteroides thetaiotaomicron TaxID=818 RepID=UPI0021D452E3|nr:helix-turn-helix domain-containing protein [Bacteroides thetaiotaomicron]MCA6031148.1 AraC family transcriptional regulator [Bacteroides thetaiotaomicron]
MGAFVTYSNLITYILPIFCSAICSVFTLLLIWNYRNLAERKLRRVVSIYCILIAVWWSSVLWHALSDDPIFLPVDIPFALSYIYIPILFYNIVYYLTYLGNKRNFPIVNYLWPIPTLTIILIASAWISPPEGGVFTELSLFERYAEIFLSSLLLRFITAAAYIVPTGLLLSRYYKQTTLQKADTDQKYLRIKSPRWLIVFFILSIAILLIAFLPSLVGTSQWLIRLNALCIMAQEVLLTYQVICRQYLSYKTSDLFPINEKKSRNNDLTAKQHPEPDNMRGQLNKRTFENYLSQEKPYLNPDFKLTDMAEAMGVNRTIMSNFINQTYGMNFKRYLNLCRIKEYQILIVHPSNECKNPYQVMVMAGFKDSRHFLRAIQLENTYKEQSHKEPQINKKG